MRLFKKQNKDSRRYVLIPIVKPGNNDVVESSSINDQLIEFYTQPYTFGDDTDNRAIDKDWDRVAVTLRKAKLYDSGCVATSAVHKLGLNKPRMAFYQWFKPRAWLEKQRLYSSYPEYSVEGNSAELGLALVLLMAASGSPYRQVIATGALRGKNGQTQLLREHDVRVRPVGQLAEKLKLVIQQVEKGELPRDKNLLFFIPKYYNQGETRVEVESLPEVQTLRTLGIQVVPIEWLSEAAKKLKADTARYLPQDLIFKWIMIALLIISLSWVSWLGWRDRVISMKFVAVNQGLEEPFIACPTGKPGKYYSLPIQKETVAVVPVRSTLGWQVKIGEANSFDSLISQWLGYEGYYVAFMIIAKFSKLKVNDRDEQGKLIRIPPGKEWSWYWDLNDKVEFNTLILLAQRTAFNSHQLKSLVELFGQTDSKKIDVPMDVTATVNFIFSQFPNGLKFMFQTVEGESQCAPIK